MSKSNCPFSKTDLVMEQKNKCIALAQRGFSFRIFRSAKEISSDWRIAQAPDCLFLTREYLAVMEQYPPAEMGFRYLLFYKENLPIGVAYCQTKTFKGADSLQETKEEKQGALARTKNFLKRKVAEQVNVSVLFCGNLFLTGEHGYYFSPDVKETVKFALLNEALEITRADYPIHLSGIFYKDFYTKTAPDALLKSMNFSSCEFLPNMIMELNPEWKNFDDYMAAMLSKYRTRVKRARKKLGTITRNDFTPERARFYQEYIYERYSEIADGAGFNIAKLHPEYLVGLKEAFPEKYKITGYYLDDELVSYRTTFLNGKELEAYFIGYNHDINHSHQLYLNMLYDMVEEGINAGVERINFERTAMEIKSSVGAVAQDMVCYFRHRQPVKNKVIGSVISYLSPQGDWKPRHPFK